MLSTTQIAVGIAGYGGLLTTAARIPVPFGRPLILLLWYFCGGCIGAGIFGPFHKQRFGFSLGLIGAFAAMFYMLNKLN